MKVMLLAAGRGERLRPLTDHCPKPLLNVGGMPLIQHSIMRLRAQGFHDLVINHAWLGARLVQYLNDGSRWGVRIRWSDESDGVLGTAGGIRQALPLLGDAPFLLVNGDLWTNYPYATLKRLRPIQAHLILAPNPLHNPDGDFAISQGCLRNHGEPMLTYSGISVLSPALVHNAPSNNRSLIPLLRAGADANTVTAEVYTGEWYDIGTQQRLDELDRKLTRNTKGTRSEQGR